MNTSPLSIRPPWPDELARTWKFLGQSRFKGQVHPQIVVTGEPERIIAASALEVDGHKYARLHLFVRERFCQQEMIDLILNKVESIAYAQKIENVGLIIPEAAPWRPLMHTLPNFQELCAGKESLRGSLWSGA